MERLFYAYGQDSLEDLPPIVAGFDQPPYPYDDIPIATPKGPLPFTAYLRSVPSDSYVFLDCVGTIRVDLLDAILSLKNFDAI